MTKGVNSTGMTVSGKTGMVSYKRYVIADAYATNIANGDPVSLSGGNLIACPETAKPIGILRGIEYIDAQGAWQMLSHYPQPITNSGSVDGFVTVVALVQPIDDQVFAMEASTTLTQANVGTNYRISGTSTLGQGGRSTAVIAVASAVTTEIRLVQVVGLLEKPGNAYSATGVDVLVKFV